MTVAAIETRPLTGRVVDGQPVLDISACQSKQTVMPPFIKPSPGPTDIHRLLKEANLRGRAVQVFPPESNGAPCRWALTLG